MLKFPNIYAHKNLKYLVLLPVVLMALGLYFSTHIVLDSSLAGGVTVQFQTNATVNTQQLASEISSKLNVPSPTVQAGSGSVQVTLSTNQSLANAQNKLVSLFAFQANYSAFEVNATSLAIQLQHNPGNATLASQLKTANAGINASIAGMQSSLSGELSYLQPFVGTPSFSSSNPSQIASFAQGEYTNASAVYEKRVVTALQTIVPFTNYSYQEITPTLSKFFLSQLELIIVVAFILIAIIVFVIFRSPIPSLAIMFGAANDIVIAIGAMGLFGIPLGEASIGGLLMLIGYSIDTEILTAIRILKRHEGTPEERAYASMKTGLTMTTTAIVTFAVLFVISIITYVPTYYEISAVVLFGLIGDIFTTWFGNASMMLLYKKRKERI